MKYPHLIIFGLVAVMGAGIFAFGFAVEHDKKILRQAVLDDEAYLVDYVKNDPTMASAVDRYFTCVEHKVKAYEGCLNYATKDAKEQEKLIAIGKRFSDEYQEITKKLLLT